MSESKKAPPYQQRVVIELGQLRSRLWKLGDFIGSELFLKLDDIDQGLLKEQRDAMAVYEAILARRVARF